MVAQTGRDIFSSGRSAQSWFCVGYNSRSKAQNGATDLAIQTHGDRDRFATRAIPQTAAQHLCSARQRSSLPLGPIANGTCSPYPGMNTANLSARMLNSGRCGHVALLQRQARCLRRKACHADVSASIRRRRPARERRSRIRPPVAAPPGSSAACCEYLGLDLAPLVCLSCRQFAIKFSPDWLIEVETPVICASAVFPPTRWRVVRVADGLFR